MKDSVKTRKLSLVLLLRGSVWASLPQSPVGEQGKSPWKSSTKTHKDGFFLTVRDLFKTTEYKCVFQQNKTKISPKHQLTHTEFQTRIPCICVWKVADLVQQTELRLILQLSVGVRLLHRAPQSEMMFNIQTEKVSKVLWKISFMSSNAPANISRMKRRAQRQKDIVLNFWLSLHIIDSIMVPR